MLQRKPLRIALLVFPLFVLSLTACDSPPHSGSTSTVHRSSTLTSGNVTHIPVHRSSTLTSVDATHTPVPNSNLLAILPVLQKSLQAMQQLKSVHVSVQGTGTIQTSGDFLPKLARGIPYSLHATADIDIAHHQGQAHAHLELLPPQAGALSLKATARLLDHVLYLQGPNHQWISLDLVSTLALLKAQVLGQLPQPQNLLTLFGDLTVTDHGVTTLQGRQVRHLTLSINQHVLDQIVNMEQQQQVKRFLASIWTPAGVGVDLFIDTATSLLVRVQIKGSFSVNVDAWLMATGQVNAPSPQARTLTVSFTLTVTLCKFNQRVPKMIAPLQARRVDLMLLLASL